MDLKIKLTKPKFQIILSLVLVVVLSGICVINVIYKNKTKAVFANSEDVDVYVYDEEVDIYCEQEKEENKLEEIIEEEIVEEKKEKQQVEYSQSYWTSPYYIKVNYGAQVVTVYGKDDNGNYTVPIKAMICSTGAATPTEGVYSIPSRWNWGGLYGNVYGQYVTQIIGDILFHSVPYLQYGNHASLEYWEYDKLGTNASMGCIRLTVADAAWIFYNCPNGTKVEFYYSDNPGPLGKPTATKISNSGDELKNWDPTDPDSANPWKDPVKVAAVSGGNNSNNVNSNNDNNENSNNNTENNDNNDVNNNNTENNNDGEENSSENDNLEDNNEENNEENSEVDIY